MATQDTKPLHEHWRDYTLDEIKKMQKEQCLSCVFFHVNSQYFVNGMAGYCDYLEKTGTPRGCGPDGCTKKVEGKPMNRRKVLYYIKED